MLESIPAHEVAARSPRSDMCCKVPRSAPIICVASCDNYWVGHELHADRADKRAGSREVLGGQGVAQRNLIRCRVLHRGQRTDPEWTHNACCRPGKECMLRDHLSLRQLTQSHLSSSATAEVSGAGVVARPGVELVGLEGMLPVLPRSTLALISGSSEDGDCTRRMWRTCLIAGKHKAGARAARSHKTLMFQYCYTLTHDVNLAVELVRHNQCRTCILFSFKDECSP